MSAAFAGHNLEVLAASATRPGSDEPTIVYRDVHHGTVVLANLIVTFGRNEPSIALLDNFVDSAKRLRVSHAKLVAMIVIESAAKPPSDEIRAATSRALHSVGPDMLAMAHVIEGKGFVAAALRGAVTTLSLLNRFPFPIHAFGEVDEAASWLSERLQAAQAGTLTSHAIAAAARVAREAPDTAP